HHRRRDSDYPCRTAQRYRPGRRRSAVSRCCCPGPVRWKRAPPGTEAAAPGPAIPEISSGASSAVRKPLHRLRFCGGNLVRFHVTTQGGENIRRLLVAVAIGDLVPHIG